MAGIDDIRVCSACGQGKPLSAFSRTNGNKIGRVSRCKACICDYHKRTRDQILTRMRSYYQEVVKPRLQESRRTNPEKHKAANRAQYLRQAGKNIPPTAERLLKRRSNRANRRAREANSVGVFSADEELKMLAAQRFKCVVCRESIKNGRHHRDHIMPLARGGSNDASNMQLLCPTCNLSKNAKDPIAFMQSRGFLL